jgi:hypothetical protein
MCKYEFMAFLLISRDVLPHAAKLSRGWQAVATNFGQVKIQLDACCDTLEHMSAPPGLYSFQLYNAPSGERREAGGEDMFYEKLLNNCKKKTRVHALAIQCSRQSGVSGGGRCLTGLVHRL